MRKVIFVISFTLLFISCDSSYESDKKTLDFKYFTMRVPLTWTYIEAMGDDSFVGTIKINDQEHIIFDFGWWTTAFDVDPLTHNITFKKIDNKKAQIVSPKNFGPGVIGVHIDNLGKSKLIKLQMGGGNFSAETQQLFLKTIETLEFKNLDKF